MMYLFVDTEFTCFEEATRELISLGIVSEHDDHEFYVEVQHNADFRSDYVQKVIIPLLTESTNWKAPSLAALDLHDWIESLPTEEVCFVYDFVGDCHLILPLLKQNSYTKKLSHMMYSAGFLHRLHELGVHTEAKIDDAFRQLMYSDDSSYYAIDPRQHHALVDAKANRHAWLRGLKAGTE